MSITSDEPKALSATEEDFRLGTLDAPDGSSAIAPDWLAEDEGAELGADERPIAANRIALAGALAAGAAAWMAGGMFEAGLVARVLGLGGVVIAAGMFVVSWRLRRPAMLQHAIIPVAMIVGAAAVAPHATGGTANLPGLVREALTGGGVRQTPIPLEPGWRFILVVVLALLAAAAIGLACARRRPKTAVLIPTPVTAAAALVQSQDAALLSGTVGIFLVIASLALAYGAEIGSAGEVGARFEIRRLGKGLGMLVVLMAGLVILYQTKFLFPEQVDKVVPPRKPPSAPLEKDRRLFTAHTESSGPWRMGVLDVYDGKGWLLPSIDPARMIDDPAPGALARPTTEPLTVEFTVHDMRGRTLPVPYGVTGLDVDKPVKLDPRTATAELDDRVPQNLTYKVEASEMPTASQLNASGPAPADVQEEFGEISAPPANVYTALLEAPTEPFARLQFLRDKLREAVVATGEGTPVDVPPARAAQLLEPNAEASPYEITAAEALLARWAGLPSRIGFGYHGGERVKQWRELRPKHAAAWVEVYFSGYGWVPLVGKPARAKASLDDAKQQTDPDVKPSELLQVELLMPLEGRSLKLLYELVRYWLFMAIPWVLGGLFVISSYPALLKAVRSRRRRRWGARHGPIGRVLVAYSEFRDRCWDLNIGYLRATPLEFTATLPEDDEHDELAWLVTRMLWSDLRRDVRVEDAEEAERMLGSLQSRVMKAQTGTNRYLARIARASLRTPYSPQIPNVWPRLPVRQSLRAARRGFVRVIGSARRMPGRQWLFGRRRAAATSALLLVMLLVGGCSSGGARDAEEARHCYPSRFLPQAAKAFGGLPPSPPPGDAPEGFLKPEPQLAKVMWPPAKLSGLELRRELQQYEYVEGSDSLLGYRFPREIEAEHEFKVALEKAPALVSDTQVYAVRRNGPIEGTVQIMRVRPDLSNAEVREKLEDLIGAGFRNYRVGPVRFRTRETKALRVFLWFAPKCNAMAVLSFPHEFADTDRLLVAMAAYWYGADPAVMAKYAPSFERVLEGVPGEGDPAITTTTLEGD